MKPPVTVISALLLGLLSFLPAGHAAPAAAPLAPGEKESVQNRSGKLILPVLELREATVPETLEFLTQQAGKLDPTGHGINLVLAQPQPNPAAAPVPIPAGIPGLAPAGPAAAPAPIGAPITRLTLSLRKVPFSEAFTYVANLTDLGLRWDEYAVVFTETERAADGTLQLKPRPEIALPAGRGGEKLLASPFLRGAILPRMSFRAANLEQACNFLKAKYQQLSPDAPPLNIVFKTEADKLRPISLSLNQIPILEAFRYIAELAGAELAAEEFALVITTPKAK